jgi:DNA helicase-2/ATP-dependent DNA helicase PcrA
VSSPRAESILAHLDPQQQEVCRQLSGPVCVLAGAGTGKTRAITHRIAYGVASGAYRPSQVLALTYTAKAAGEMRIRLGRLGVREVQARTFHSAALAQLRHFWPREVGDRPPHLIPGKLRLLGTAAERTTGALRPETLRDVAAEIEWRKVRDLTLDQFAQLGRPEPAGLEPGQLVRLMREYERVKDARGEMDFEDVLLATLGMLTQVPAVAAEVRERYRVFVVDEFQDISPVQFLLLRAWLGARRDVCVVGDPSQTIYSFAGADARLLTGFPEQFPDATVLRLTHNYRSTSQIVGVANRLIGGEPGALRLESDRPGPAVEIQAFPDQVQEADAVAAWAASLIAGGADPSALAVLVRVNAQTAEFERAFAAAGVPCALRQAQPFFARPSVARAVVMLRAEAASPASAPFLDRVDSVLRECGWGAEPPVGSESWASWADLQALRDLAAGLPAGTDLAGFSADLLERKAAAVEPATKAVTISTIHAAKGLEWSVVFVTGLCDGSLPISAARTPELQEEELRLLYVATTRARERLFLSWPGRVGSSRRSPSPFLARLRSRPGFRGTSTLDGTAPTAAE